MSLTTQTARKRKASTVRYTKRPGYKNTYGAKNNDYLETFITQCMVSGIILAIALFINIFDTPFAASAKASLKGAVRGNADLLDSSEDFRSLAENTLSSIKAKFSGNEPKADAEEETPAFEYDLDPDIYSDYDFRIDEEILADIYSENDYYMSEIKNEMAPLD